MNSSAGLGFLCKLGDLATQDAPGQGLHEGGRRGDARSRRLSLPEKVSSSPRCPPTRGCCVFPLDEIPERPNGGVGVQLIALPEKASRSPRSRATDGKSLVVSGRQAKEPRDRDLDAKQLAEHVGKRAQRGRVCDVGFRPDRLEPSP